MHTLSSYWKLSSGKGRNTGVSCDIQLLLTTGFRRQHHIYYCLGFERVVCHGLVLLLLFIVLHGSAVCLACPLDSTLDWEVLKLVEHILCDTYSKEPVRAR